jgi:ANTAR domain-containing protein
MVSREPGGAVSALVVCPLPLLFPRCVHFCDRGDGMAQHQQNTDFWQERATQLQQALDSRVVIEQAKGVLGERFDLDMQAAFAVLRGSARAGRLKLHALAHAVVRDRETPEPIIRWLASNPEIVEQPARAERIYRTELDFKRLNQALAAQLGDGDGRFLCECANPHCSEPLELSADDLRALHSEEHTFAIVPGHELPDLETVILTRDGYAIVRKHMEKLG